MLKTPFANHNLWIIDERLNFTTYASSDLPLFTGNSERPDLIAYQYLGDPEQYWRISDPNSVLQPEELTARPGTQIRITLPEGIPGPSNA